MEVGELEPDGCHRDKTRILTHDEEFLKEHCPVYTSGKCWAEYRGPDRTIRELTLVIRVNIMCMLGGVIIYN